MIIQHNVKKEWTISSAYDFLRTFQNKEKTIIQKVLREDYAVKYWKDIYESHLFDGDNELIESILEKSKRKYTIDFFEENDGY